MLSQTVSNYAVKHMEEIKSANLPLPAINQLEIHPLCQHHDIVEYCNANKIQVVAYSSLAPLTSWRPDKSTTKPSHNSTTSTTTNSATTNSATTATKSDNLNESEIANVVLSQKLQELDEFLQILSLKYHATTAQILLKWALQHDYPILPKSCTEARIADNCNLFFFAIEASDMRQLDAFDMNRPFAWPMDPCAVE